MNKNIIVTGGLGFIGSNLIDLLIKKKFNVINIDKFSYSSNFYNIKNIRNNKKYKYIKCNIGNKKNRHGFFTAEIESAALTISSFYNTNIKGIMIIPPLTESKKEYIRYFKKAKKIKDRLQKKIKTCTNLSMGMSNDYVEAIKEGATHIRLGTALFGERQK